MPGYLYGPGGSYQFGKRKYRDRYGLFGSVANLPAALTINGTTVLPTFRYNGIDAGPGGLPSWEYGSTLALQAGTAPTFGQTGYPGCDGSEDGGVLFNSGGYFRHANTTYGDGTTEDRVSELIIQLPATMSGTHVIAGKSLNATSAGYCWYTASNVLYYLVGDGVGTAQAGGVVTPGAVILAHAFVDRSGSMQVYVNGAALGGAIAINTLGSFTNAEYFALGARGTGVLSFGGKIIYYAEWVSADWLDTHLQADVSTRRFALLSS